MLYIYFTLPDYTSFAQFLWPVFITIILINNKPYHSLAPSVPSTAPQNIRSLLLTSTSAEILWDPPPLEDQNGHIQNYTLLITEVDTDRIFGKVVENASITLQELQPLYTYQFVVAARTVVGLGPFSSRYSLQVPESAPGAPVRNFTVEVISATSVKLSWVPPDPQLWNGVITNYTVVYKLLGPVGMTPAETVTTMVKAIPTRSNPLVNNPDPRHATVPLQNETVILNHLQEHFVYEFSVFMENAAGRSEMSVAIIQELPGTEPSGAPKAVQIHNISSTSIDVQWQPPDFLDQNGVLTGYTVVHKNWV